MGILEIWAVVFFAELVRKLVEVAFVLMSDVPRELAILSKVQQLWDEAFTAGADKMQDGGNNKAVKGLVVLLEILPLYSALVTTDQDASLFFSSIW